MSNTICFIGAGNMAQALIGGLVRSGYAPENIHACDPSEQTLEILAKQTPDVKTFTDNNEGLTGASVVVLAIKPQVLKSVLMNMTEVLQQTRPLLVSIAAGIDETSLDQWSGGGLAIVRCMPNTPALVQLGASGLYANSSVTPQQQQLAENILSAVGICTWVNKESQLDAVTALSGSGPAYFFLVIEAMQEAGVRLGLPKDVAQTLGLQTALGAATMAQQSDVDVAELRRRVTSPNGTTEAALDYFNKAGLAEIFNEAMTKAHQRSIELANELGDN